MWIWHVDWTSTDLQRSMEKTRQNRESYWRGLALLKRPVATQPKAAFPMMAVQAVRPPTRTATTNRRSIHKRTCKQRSTIGKHAPSFNFRSNIRLLRGRHFSFFRPLQLLSVAFYRRCLRIGVLLLRIDPRATPTFTKDIRSWKQQMHFDFIKYSVSAVAHKLIRLSYCCQMGSEGELLMKVGIL